jgi:hypothetical protein
VVTYYICTVSPKFPENYQIGIRANCWGVEEKYRKRIAGVKPGDMLLFVIGGEFISIHTIESAAHRDESILWPPKNGDVFPWRVTISDPVLKGAAVIKGDLQHKISFMKGKFWGGTIQGASGVFNDRLTHEDFELIKSKMVMGKSPKKRPPGKVIRRSAQRNQPVHRYPANQPSERQQCLFKFYEADIEERILSMLGEMNLELYHDLKTGKTGKQFVIDGGRIDLLCTDQQTGDFVIIELKKGEAPQETLLQILRYMSWVKQHMPIKGRNGVKGIILTEQADTDLQHYLEEVPNVIIRYYRLSISLI